MLLDKVVTCRHIPVPKAIFTGWEGSKKVNRFRYMFLSILVGVVLGGIGGYLINNLPLGLGIGFLVGLLVGLARNR